MRAERTTLLWHCLRQFKFCFLTFLKWLRMKLQLQSPAVFLRLLCGRSALGAGSSLLKTTNESMRLLSMASATYQICSVIWIGLLFYKSV